MKLALTFLIFLAVMLFCFLVVFPGLLGKRKPWWPISAYGFCMALVLTCTFAAGLVLFWDNLVMGRPGLKPWFDAWGGRCLLIVAWFLAVSIVWTVFRSPHARRSAKKPVPVINHEPDS